MASYMNIKKLVSSCVLTYIIVTIASYFAVNMIRANSNLQGKVVNKSSSQEIDESEPQEPRTEECPINGVMYGKTARNQWEKRRPLGVVIENHHDARPQSGISKADVVYEGVTEGGVTRTLSMYYCQNAGLVGPIRSARVHFINLLREWGQYPLYAHVGGANCNKETGSGCANGAPADAMGLIDDLNWRLYNDLDPFGNIPKLIFVRDNNRLPNVATEHTVYARTEKIWEFAEEYRKLTDVDKDGVAWNEGWTPWSFADEATLSERGSVAHIGYDFYESNTDNYSVNWRYDKASNSYLRSHGKKPHIDKNTGKQLSSKNIFVIFADESPAYDDYPGGHVVYDLLSGGDMLAFQNGNVIEGTWSKEELDSKMVFLDDDGEEISVVRGQVWISLLPNGNEVYSSDKAKSEQSTQDDKKIDEKD
jgi:hypothetical protein